MQVAEVQRKISYDDKVLRDTLSAYQEFDKDYWSFRGNAAREHAHAYFQYPAMMVPQMQGDLLRAALNASPASTQVLDPFVGSGTALTESMMLGLDFSGFDINPLAVLLCRAKTIPFYVEALKGKFCDLLRSANKSRSNRISAKFPGWQKWFRRDVAIALSRIRFAIQEESSLWARQFFWIAMAETVRLSSNSRTSTFKLHKRPEDEQGRLISPLDIFATIAQRNLNNLSVAKCKLQERGFLQNGRYKGNVEIYLADSARDNGCLRKKADLLITSPPYGDNATTIPYGQHSYLPLQWVDLKDIDVNIDPDFLRTTHEIDRRSLGGIRRVMATEQCELRDKSASFTAALDAVRDQPKDRIMRISAFCRDLDRTIDPILAKLEVGAYMIWIVGNRSIGGRALPLDRILTELLLIRGAVAIGQFSRRIPTKRMAIRNDVAETMGREAILVFRKA